MQIFSRSVGGNYVSFWPSTYTRSIARKSWDIAKDGRLNYAKLLLQYLHDQYPESGTQTVAILSKSFPWTTQGQYCTYHPNACEENDEVISGHNVTYVQNLDPLLMSSIMHEKLFIYPNILPIFALEICCHVPSEATLDRTPPQKGIPPRTITTTDSNPGMG